MHRRRSHAAAKGTPQRKLALAVLRIVFGDAIALVAITMAAFVFVFVQLAHSIEPCEPIREPVSPS